MRKTTLLACTAVSAMLIGGGCATRGEDQNYRVLQEDEPILQENREPRSRAMPLRPPFAPSTAFVVYQEEPAGETAQEDLPADPYAPPLLAEFGVAVPRPNSDPSGVLRRDHWSTVVVGPEDGTVSHLPIYYEERRLGITYSNVLEQPTVEAQLETALASGEVTFNRVNYINTFTDPIAFAIDTALLPIRAVITPPWRRVETPEREPVVVDGAIVLVPIGPVENEIGWRGLLGINDLIGPANTGTPNREDVTAPRDTPGGIDADAIEPAGSDTATEAAPPGAL